MDYNQVMNKVFYVDFFNANDMAKVIEHIESRKGTFEIDTRDLSITEAVEKMRNPNAIFDLSIELTEDGIAVPYLFDDFYKVVLNHIPRDITTLRMYPSDFDPEDFKDFKNLNTFETNEFLSTRELERIMQIKSIKNIKAVVGFGLMDGYSNYATDRNKIIYMDIVIENVASKDDTELKIKIDKYDSELIKNFISKYNMDRIDTIIINIGEKNPSYIKDCIQLVKKDNGYIIYYQDYDLDVLSTFYYDLKKMGILVQEINFSLEIDYKKKSGKIKYTEVDYTKLDKVAKEVPITVGYDSSYIVHSNYEDFRNLSESIKYYQSLIKDFPLSPLEKLTFAYDIMKTFEYKENDEDKSMSRQPSKIMNSDYIVCSGYTAMLEELLYGIDPNIGVDHFGEECYDKEGKELLGYHSRSVVRINDDKYNIHGFYAMDPTWDSVHEKFKDTVEGYNALSEYGCFLVPFPEYKKFFPHDKGYNFFCHEFEILNTQMNKENVEKCMEELNKKHEGEEPAKIKPYNYDKNVCNFSFPESLVDRSESTRSIIESFNNSRRLTFEEFMSLIRTVRRAEGFANNFLENDLDVVARINSKYYGVEYNKERENVL